MPEASPPVNVSSPLVARARPERFDLPKVLTLLAVCATYIAVSAALINFNKLMMDKSRFPYSVPLTGLHMLGSLLLSCILYAFTGERLYKSMPVLKENFSAICLRMIPLSVCFAVSVICSNQAYIYASVPFLQMMKEGNIVMVYAVGLFLAVEKYDAQIAMVLVLIMFGCTLSVHGEMNFHWLGFSFQASSQVCEVTKIILQQKIMQGFKLDPLTMVFIMAPLCLVSVCIGLFFVWDPAIWIAMQANWRLLAANCCVAFALNVAVATVISYASGVSFIVTGVVKDVCIVTTAAVVFHTQISYMQVVGFSTAVMGVFSYSILRSMPEVAKAHGLAKTVLWALFAIPPEKALVEDDIA